MKKRKIPNQPFGLLVELSSSSEAQQLRRPQLLEWVREHKLVVVRGLRDIGKKGLLELASADSDNNDLVHWNFGPVMEMQASPQAENYLFSREHVPFHWDGAFHEVPSVLLFHCLEAPHPEGGGETTFCDTEALLAESPRAERALWEKLTLTYQTEKKAHYGGRFTTKMVVRHPQKGCPVLRYAEPVESSLNPVSLTVHGELGNQADFFERMRSLLYSTRYCYAHRWESQDLLLADNHSLLHGRRGFSAASPRHLRRVQLR